MRPTVWIAKMHGTTTSPPNGGTTFMTAIVDMHKTEVHLQLSCFDSIYH